MELSPKQVVGYWVLIVILIVSTFSTALAARHAANAAENTDLIAECTTPGTRCAELRRVTEEAEQKFFNDLISKSSRCIIESGPPNSPDRLGAYDRCIAAVTTTTTTMPQND